MPFRVKGGLICGHPRRLSEIRPLNTIGLSLAHQIMKETGEAIQKKREKQDHPIRKTACKRGGQDSSRNKSILLLGFCFGQDCYTSNQCSHNFTKAKSPTTTNIKQQNNIKPSCQKYTSTPTNNYTASVTVTVTLTLSRKCEATLPLGTKTT